MCSTFCRNGNYNYSISIHLRKVPSICPLLKRKELYNRRLTFQTLCAAWMWSEASWQAKWIHSSSLIPHPDGKKACCSSKRLDSQLHSDRLLPLVATTDSQSTAASARQKLQCTLEVQPRCLCLNHRAENLTCRDKNSHNSFFSGPLSSFPPLMSKLAYYRPTQEF